jgi:hypothetical protein
MRRTETFDVMHPLEQLDFTTREVSQLWSFLDGAIMNVETRHHLWRTWGLCPRHSWGYAVLEVELRGGLPFSTTILYEDLIVRAARSLTRSLRLPWSVARRSLESRGECYTCDYEGLAHGPGAPGAQDQAQLANTRRRFRPLLLGSQEHWRPVTCPSCLGGSGPVCRQHLLAGVEPGSRDDLAAWLSQLARRLGRFKESMTWRGPEATEFERVSWVEAIGWFSGWRYPAAMLVAHDPKGLQLRSEAAGAKPDA